MLPLACEGGVGVVVVGGGWWWGGPWRPSHGDRGGVRGGSGMRGRGTIGFTSASGERSVNQSTGQSIGGDFR